jgi:hypothetical protein
MKIITRSFLLFSLFIFLSFLILVVANYFISPVFHKGIPPSQIYTKVVNTPIPTPQIGNGDADMNNIIDTKDINYILSNWNRSASGSIDQYKDGKVNTLDFVVTAKKLNK